MKQTKAKRMIYNSVFVDLFSSPENQLRLYKDLHPEDEDVTVSDIRDVTLKPVFTDQIYNDLGFRVGDRAILLVEAQSTWSTNISLRTLIYLAETFKQYVLDSKQNYYSGSPVSIPRPELYVIYTGPDRHEEESMSLAETFWDGDDSFVDVKVKVIQARKPGDILTQYAAFCDIYRSNKARYGETKEAVEKTITECMEKDVLKEYLQEKRSEVVDMITALFDDDFVQEMYENSLLEEGLKKGRAEGIEKGLKDGIEKGLEDGRSEGLFEAVDSLISETGYSAEEACRLLHADVELYRDYKNKSFE